MNKKYFYKLLLLSGIVLLASCTPKGVVKTTEKVAISQEDDGDVPSTGEKSFAVAPTYQSNIEAYFKSNTPSKVNPKLFFELGNRYFEFR